MEAGKLAARVAGWVGEAVRGFATLPRLAQAGVVMAAVAGPALAFMVAGGAGDGPGRATLPAGIAPAGAATDGGEGRLLGAASLPSIDPERVLDRLAREGARAEAAVHADQDDGMDFDDALERLVEGVESEDGGDGLIRRLRESPQGSRPEVLVSHSLPLMAAGDAWGAVANLLVAHEADEDDATALVALAAIANSKGLPAVALALLDRAERLGPDAGSTPVGMHEYAALLNNRGHALLLQGRYADAEAALREALQRNPEMSEAARNLVHALLRQDRRDEARMLVPRATWRLRGQPGQPVPTRDEEGGKGEPAPPAGSEEQVAGWTRAPWLEQRHGQLSLPLWIALDLSRQGQIAWPHILYPAADESYATYATRASARFLAAREKAAALREQMGPTMTSLVVRRMTLGESIQQAIHTRVSTPWMLEPIDTDMHPLDAGKERLILASGSPTRFAALDAARAEYEMERAADRLYERYRRDARCPVGSTSPACCAIHRREVNRNIAEFTPYARDYEEQMRVFFGQAYGLSTAITSNLPAGGWHDLSRIEIEQQVLNLHGHVQREVAFAFSHAAPSGSACYGPVGDATGEAPEVVVDAPACSAASQWASGKWAFSNNFSVEATCGKIKFVAEINVIGTRKFKWGPLSDVGADLGMHAEAEFSMDGTVTIFAGPKGGVSGKVGGIGGDFGAKDGIYAVIGREGVKDVGFRVVIGGGVAAGQGGATHDVEVMDFSLVSAI
ncbi:tetratricopeptide repeat protein [Arenimonas donghaensis]|uniref:Uncharacterized protein n=1 Tax=Arenimonas donghaensis DSM 18148 = HO3-R19 TaxID=1121014 RepID=A0A087MGS9_9GAMM|nr:tetratricopeptide repeat protein [Arenimonas donghaensis]KFL36082.1 hypothetical protein N788_05920 [Arenimonas donghaensis DSM 18148 = HO3-R19]